MSIMAKIWLHQRKQDNYRLYSDGPQKCIIFDNEIYSGKKIITSFYNIDCRSENHYVQFVILKLN